MFFGSRKALLLATGTSDPDVAKWVAAGGSQSQAVIKIVTTMVQGFKTDGSWSTIDDVILHPLDTQAGARIWIKSRTVLTEHNSPTWAQFVGYTGDGSSTFLDYGINPSTLTNYKQNSGHIGTYMSVVDSRNAFHNYVGLRNSTANDGPNLGRDNANRWWGAVNANNTTALSGGSSSTTGYGSSERTSSSTVNLYVNSDSVTATTSASTSQAIENANLYGLGQNQTGTGAVNFTNGTLCATLIGASGLQALGVRSRVNTAVAALIAL